MVSQGKVFLNGKVTLHGGDCRDVLKSLPDNSIDSVVTDPPYALVSIVKRFGGENAAPAKSDGATGVYQRASSGFMGKTWDTGETAFVVEFWAEVLRVLKPGGHIVAFSGTRTYHRMACAIEDAGFEIRDQIADLIAADTFVQAFMRSLSDEQQRAFLRCIEESGFSGMLQWAFGSGFPKSHNVSAAIDKAAGAERVLTRAGRVERAGYGGDWDTGSSSSRPRYDSPATDFAKQWDGWGSALKPAHEPICLARKPLIGTIAQNVLTHGTGALNIDGCRVESGVEHMRGVVTTGQERNIYGTQAATFVVTDSPLGRFPANLIHDGSEEVTACFPGSAGQQGDVRGTEPSRTGGDDTNRYGKFNGRVAQAARLDSGSAARFFYTAKADSADRIGSKHPTVKPVDLMQYLVRLVTRKGGVVLDPFAGTGTTGEAAWREGMRCILIEREEEYQADIARRMELAENPTKRAAVAATKNNLEDPLSLPLFASLAEETS